MGFKETDIGLIPKDWNLFELKDKVSITMGQSPKSKFYNSDGIGIPFLQGRKTFGDKYHTIDTWCTDPKRIAKKGDVLMSVRAPVGDVNIAINDLCIGRGLASLRMYNGNNEFLYYLLKNYVDKIMSRETGTVFGSINKNGIETLRLPFPSDREQKAIARILSTLDEKIEVNNKINKTLEEMAQAIFKHWFIDFEFPNENGEPYKSSGGEMVESELGMMPKGWEIKELGKLVFRNNDKFKDKDEWEKLNIIDLSVMPKYCISINKFSKGVNFNTNIYKLNEFDILFGSIRSYFGKTGFSPINGGVVGTVLSMCPEEYNDYCFILFSITSKEFIDYSVSMSQGTKMPVFKFSDLEKYKVLYNENISKKFNNIVFPIVEKIRENILANQTLGKIRDVLLPKLLSGEIRSPLL